MKPLVLLVLVACAEPYDPLAFALARPGLRENRDAPVPSACYARTDGVSNPCWVCHTAGQNPLNDLELQEAYAFSAEAMTNHWTNLFVDRRAAIAAIPDEEILAYVRQDNLAGLAEALRADPRYQGYLPDLDVARGFDEDGFARDGSDWRALRYKPFPGISWPASGSLGDVFLRLPEAFRRDAQGRPSRAVYKVNLAILELAIAGPERDVEPLDEAAAGLDLDGDGLVVGTVTRVRELPAHYVGAAAHVPVRPGQHPAGTEYLHGVRYLDPDAPSLAARRLKELRHARKVFAPDDAAVLAAYDEEYEEKAEGLPPRFAGDARVGLRNDHGWQLIGFIEDVRGRLRVQSEEELYACMGCHTNLGVTIDQTFSLARKLPGAAGWRMQDLRGIPDVPQLGHTEPEVLTYLRRAGRGEEVRAGVDLFELLAPTRSHALALDKAYREIVREQSFTRGRDAVIAASPAVLERIDEVSTRLGARGRVYADGRLRLDWSRTDLAGANGSLARGEPAYESGTGDGPERRNAH